MIGTGYRAGPLLSRSRSSSYATPPPSASHSRRPSARRERRAFGPSRPLSDQREPPTPSEVSIIRMTGCPGGVRGTQISGERGQVGCEIEHFVVVRWYAKPNTNLAKRTQALGPANANSRNNSVSVKAPIPASDTASRKHQNETTNRKSGQKIRDQPMVRIGILPAKREGTKPKIRSLGKIFGICGKSRSVRRPQNPTNVPKTVLDSKPDEGTSSRLTTSRNTETNPYSCGLPRTRNAHNEANRRLNHLGGRDVVAPIASRDAEPSRRPTGLARSSPGE